jgi:hypothetical protein
VLVRLDRDEDRHAGIHLGRIEDGDSATDHARLLEFLNAPPARRCRKADLLADLGHGARTILLQNGEDLDIHIIEHARRLEM